MPENQTPIDAARRMSLSVADTLIVTAKGAIDAGDIDYADVIVLAVMRVLDGYEAVTQLHSVRELAATPNKPIPFRTVP